MMSASAIFAVSAAGGSNSCGSPCALVNRAMTFGFVARDGVATEPPTSVEVTMVGTPGVAVPGDAELSPLSPLSEQPDRTRTPARPTPPCSPMLAAS